MRGLKPNHKLWAKINQVILGESAGAVINTCFSAFCQILIQGGICPDEDHARAHLAAMLLSPDTSDKVGSLLPLVPGELSRLDDGKWLA